MCGIRIAWVLGAVLLLQACGDAPDPAPREAEPVTLQVLDPRGVPVRKAQVRFDGDGLDATDRKNRVRTDAEGLATTPALAGRVHLYVCAPGHGAVRRTIEPDKRSAERVVVTLREAFTFQARVVNTQNEPVAGALVKLVHQPALDEVYGDADWAAELMAKTEADGRFAIEDVPIPSIFFLEVEADGYRPFRIKMGMPKTVMDIRIERLD